LDSIIETESGGEGDTVNFLGGVVLSSGSVNISTRNYGAGTANIDSLTLINVDASRGVTVVVGTRGVEFHTRAAFAHVGSFAKRLVKIDAADTSFGVAEVKFGLGAFVDVVARTNEAEGSGVKGENELGTIRTLTCVPFGE